MSRVYTAEDMKRIINEQEATNRRNAQAEINQAFKEVTQDSINELPEDIFVQSFLPLFAGRLSASESKIALNDWVGVAGSPSNPVAIVDAAGKRVFVVPPVVATFAIRPARKLNDPSAPVGEIISNYVLNRGTSPQAAAVILSRDMVRKIDSISSDKTVDTANEKVAAIWQSIFARYKIKEVKSEAAKPQLQGDAGDDMVFEDA